jgi:hypothetical protein
MFDLLAFYFAAAVQNKKTTPPNFIFVRLLLLPIT